MNIAFSARGTRRRRRPSPGGLTWRRIGWQGAAGTIFVTYHDDARGGTMTVGVSDVILSEGRAHAAYTVRFSQPHPIGPANYADRLVRAWGRGDHQATGAYATATAAAALFAHAVREAPTGDALPPKGRRALRM